LIGLLREGSQRYSQARSPSDLTEQAAVGAAVSIVGVSLADKKIGPLPELTRALVQIILTPYLGGEEARRISRTA
jgi:hypothetical protein